ncbi:MAG: 2-amino-4-hydroxy-6-hydroxymethyldihydropteridine diphosphokinase [Deltaproteobacteria bacterium]|nr:2-amino-4-hydroxy-6-hydroxymethyldihydropteridine diphosphokinase [Deltaproteobacteria bacterium]
MRVFIGLGANLGDAAMTMARAVGELRKLGPIRVAPLYRTEPVGPPQPSFLNSAVELEVELGLEELLARAREIEVLLGRRRGERWGPREIDLDILAGPSTHVSALLVVPHPELARRRFALTPLSDLTSERIVGLDATAEELLSALDPAGVELAEDTTWADWRLKITEGA